MAEDDHSCRSALLQYFDRSGYRVTEAADGPSTLRAVFQHSASLVILDLGLPGFDGMDVLAKIRRHSAVPVIVCSGRDSEEDRIRTLNLGADDFVVKPFSFAELEARVRAVLRRGNGEPAATCLHLGELVVDRDTRTVTVRDESVPMTRKEFDLLAFLAASPGQVFSREDLLERVWGSTEEWQGRSTVTEHVRPRTPEDRARPRLSPLDHHRPRCRLSLHSARRLKSHARRRPACAGRRPTALALRAPNFLVQKSYGAGSVICRHRGHSSAPSRCEEHAGCARAYDEPVRTGCGADERGKGHGRHGASARSTSRHRRLSGRRARAGMSPARGGVA